MTTGLTPAQRGWRLTRLENKERQFKTMAASNVTDLESPAQNGPLFQNDFQMEDLMVFDDNTLHELLINKGFGLTAVDLAKSLHDVKGPVVERIKHNLPYPKRTHFLKELHRPRPKSEIEMARRQVLDGLFWELTYWKTPELYEELTEGEKLHPGIFKKLEPDLRGKVVLDAGAGSGRASFECLQYGAKLVHAVEPSPGLLKILEKKLAKQNLTQKIIPHRGRFDHLPLEDNSVNLAISCSAFTAEPEQGGEPGLVELKRVTKPGGKIVIIWPRPEDYEWLEKQGFNYVKLPVGHEMKVRFRSLQSAMRAARRFYHKNRAIIDYLRHRQQPEVPFSMLGFTQPRDFCWLEVKK